MSPDKHVEVQMDLEDAFMTVAIQAESEVGSLSGNAR